MNEIKLVSTETLMQDHRECRRAEIIFSILLIFGLITLFTKINNIIDLMALASADIMLIIFIMLNIIEARVIELRLEIRRKK